MKVKPTVLVNFDYSLAPHSDRLEFSPPHLLQKALTPFFDVYKRGDIDPKEADVVFNTLPIIERGGTGNDLFLTGKITMFWDTIPLEQINKQYFDICDYIFQPVPSYMDRYPSKKTELLLPGVDSEHYYNIQSELIYDVGFLGSEVEAYRINLLDELEQEFTVLRGATDLGVVSSALLSQCRMVLSIDDYFEKKAGIEYRMFTFGNIRPILAHYNPDYDFIGKKFYHYIPYQSTEELKDRIGYYIMHTYEREGIKKNMIRNLYLRHTYGKRAKQVFNAFKKLKRYGGTS